MHGTTNIKFTNIFTALSLNMVKNFSLYGYVAVFIYIQTSNLSLIPHGSCPCMYSAFCVKGD